MPVSIEAGSAGLRLDDGWPERWRVEWRSGRESRFCSVRELALAPMVSVDPVRGFSWNRNQRHRPGLQYMVSTGRLHGAESMQEARLLLALDFAGDVLDVVSQPLKLVFGAADGERSHTPDYLAVTRQGVWLIDVRPERLIKPVDLEKFAAAAETSLTCGWRYTVAARWREHVPAALDAISSQRRALSDPLGLRPILLDLIRDGRRRFGEAAAASGCEPVARAQLLNLLWQRALGVDLSEPLGDRSMLVPASGGML
ncbi:MAG TPA: TnsA-like heteromeric transposase endonuclease subunit [Actinocrinis sp.]|uniref:TnsA-like heteromeric transposase endonuclease subunit n=1 Tax=Actinocrinis sp. TaxID=1920516 RepID=UPI002DDD328D|nr:TnsA-like heteromeric transposase endonuclease subunit [Actinocrinis sp.]HEV2345148.1 TnsA-like heteromeric transposase endonuclease subunit [Actinocrinis sp.]